MEFSRLYLDKMFTEIMGFEIVRAQGLQTNGVAVSQALKQAKMDLKAAFERFYD